MPNNHSFLPAANGLVKDEGQDGVEPLVLVQLDVVGSGREPMAEQVGRDDFVPGADEVLELGLPRLGRAADPVDEEEDAVVVLFGSKVGREAVITLDSTHEEGPRPLIL
jgi:hypothetical protein